MFSLVIARVFRLILSVVHNINAAMLLFGLLFYLGRPFGKLPIVLYTSLLVEHHCYGNAHYGRCTCFPACRWK